MSRSQIESRTLATGETALAYQLRRTNRRRTVALSVGPDQSVTVLAPFDATVELVEGILARKLRWIRSQQASVAALPSPTRPRQWISGETHRYLGRQYRLKISRGEDSSVKLIGGYFVVSTTSPDKAKVIGQLMRAWYRERATTLLRARISKILSETTWLSLAPPPIAIRPLKLRWGSAAPSGRLTFNIDLVKLPIGCIDYVVCHELVHLQVYNHSTAFWRLLGRVMPDWKRWRDRLATTEY